MKPMLAESGRAKRFAATALRPAVRRAVTQLPSIAASGRPVSLSSSVTSELIAAMPRAGLRGFSTSDLVTTIRGSSVAASVAMM